MSLKKNKFKILTLVTIYILLSYGNFALANSKIENVVEYLNNLDNFSASFIQETDGDVSEGIIYVGEKRVRVDYNKPSKILIILDKKKAMYYNYDLDEDEFFDPTNTSAWFFFDIFRNPNFFIDSNFVDGNSYISIKKSGSIENMNYNLNLDFEQNPLILRKIELIIGKEDISFSIFNHSFNENFDRRFFKLINPTLLN